MFQHLAHFLCALSELFLKFAHQLVILAFSVGEVVVGQLSVLLLELALDFIPGALELEFVHINCSGLGGTVVIRSAASEAFIERLVSSRQLHLKKSSNYPSRHSGSGAAGNSWSNFTNSARTISAIAR
jgi:hypothetical protein